ncbi:MAG TPA: hypothetical protein VMS65_05110 [Polyangiaceae bacterium]|nr:hypothetical protein [Polyangiaceae bacterium]
MSFLGRIAARATAPSLAPGAGGARSTGEAAPNMPSRSPFVRFDQRLTLPGYAEVAPVARATGSELDGADGLAASNEAGTIGTSNDAVATPFAATSPAWAILGAAETESAPERALAASDPSFALTPSASPSSLSTNERSTQAAELRPPARLPEEASRPAPENASRDAAELTPAASLESRESAGRLGPADASASPRSVFDAVARLDSWLRTESRDVEQGLPAAALSAAASSSDVAEPAVAPTISIGKLEIEVVPPALEARFRSATPSQEQRRQRPVQRAPRPVPSGGARGFGWRQR